MTSAGIPAADDITIRRMRIADAPAFARMLSDPKVFPGTLQGPYASDEGWTTRMTESLAPGKPDVLLVAERNGELIGVAGLHPVGPLARRRHAMLLGITVAAAAQGQGVGRLLMAALCEQADRWLQVLRIELTVFADNAPAIALYRRFGFEIEGTHRAFALRDGVYADALAMARLHPNPPVLHGS